MTDDVSAPEIVYHYTSMEAMKKIVESATIWATSIRYLNDVSERDLFIGLIRERIPNPLLSTVGSGSVFERVQNPDNYYAEDFLQQPFVASFSADADSLPQWRSYCPNGNGVSIGFRANCLERADVLREASPRYFGPSSATYRRVTYIDPTQTDFIDAVIKASSKEAMETEIANQSDESMSSITAADYFLVDIEERTCFIKHSSFSNENEFRLAISLFWSYKYLEYRATRSTLAPYVTLHIPRKDTRELISPGVNTLYGDLEKMDFVARVVIGPTPNKDLSRSAVDAYFKTKGMNVEVVSSSVPFRDI